MKCPYPDCRKDYNDQGWQGWTSKFVNGGHNLSNKERAILNRVYVKSRQCRFCSRLFHEIFVGNEEYVQENPVDGSFREKLEFLCSYPASKTKFESMKIPKEVIASFNEAERCRAVGALTGTSACLRKCVYAICDDKEIEGKDYKEKIVNLPVSKKQYSELLKQVKFLGDNMTKPNGSDYSKDEIDIALQVLPIVIDDLYSTDEKVSLAEKVLAKIRSQKEIPVEQT